MIRARALLLVALLVALVACGGTAATPTPVPPTPAPAATPAAASPAAETEASEEPEASLGAVTGGVATRVNVTIKDYAFEPATITVPAGEITFVLDNTAGQEHEFEIFKGDAVVDEAEGLVPGLSRDFVVTLPAGEYTYVCKLADHEARGMKGTLTVTAG